MRRAGAVVVGGHTVRDQEIKYGLSVTGVVHPAGLVTNRQAQPGDQLLLTKPLGTGYVTTAAKAGNCPDDVLQAAVVSMCRLNRVASEAAVAAGTHAMTDVTGFGLIGHASEMAAASGVSIELHLQQLPLLPGAVELGQQGFRTRANRSNRAYAEPMLRSEGELDPDRLELCFDAQTSGGLLISVPPAAVEALIRRVVDSGEPRAEPCGPGVGPRQLAVIRAAVTRPHSTDARCGPSAVLSLLQGWHRGSGELVFDAKPRRVNCPFAKQERRPSHPTDLLVVPRTSQERNP